MEDDDIDKVMKELEEGQMDSNLVDNEPDISDEIWCVQEAMDKGLIQVHRTIFCLICENPNGLNNRITKSDKLER